MAVVTITAILALVGVSLFRHQLLASKGTEAASVIQAIRSAEEAYSAENHVYLNVSTGGGAVNVFDTKWYPVLTPNTGRSSWIQPGHVDYPRWQALAPSVNRSVMFGYLVYAGGAGSNVPALALAQNPGFPRPMILDWYVIQARGDADGNGVFAQYAASSKTSELVIENEGE
jgi:type IV pilus assembly protein PilA